MYACQLLSLMYSKEMQTTLISLTDKYMMVPFMSILNASKIFPLFMMAFNLSENESISYFLIISIFLNSLFITYIAFRLFLKLFKNNKNLDKKW